jgi:hypothetical protein
MHRARSVALAAALLALATPADADADEESLEGASEEHAVESQPKPRATLALRPALVVPFGRVDTSRMKAAPGGGLDAEVSLRPSRQVEVGLLVGATLSPLLESSVADLGERTGSVTSYRVGSFVQVLSSLAPLAVYGRAGASYRLLVQRVNYAPTGSASGPVPAERNTDFYDGAELDLGAGVALSTGSLRIEPGVDFALCRLWYRGDEPKGTNSGPGYFASLGIRGAFDVR